MLRLSKSLPELYLPLIKFDVFEDDYEITQPVNIFREFKDKSLILGIPGAFLPSYQWKFLQEYRRYSNEIRALCKVEKIAVLSINDPFVLKTFAEEIDAEDKLIYISDFQGECSKALGTTINLPELGIRSLPFRGVVNKGELGNWVCEDDWKFTEITRVHRLLTEFSPYLPYPDSIYPSNR